MAYKRVYRRTRRKQSTMGSFTLLALLIGIGAILLLAAMLVQAM